MKHRTRKKWYRSATVIINGVTAVLGGGIELANQFSPFITDEKMHTKILTVVAIANALSNGLLRIFKTQEPILAKPKEVSQ